MADTGGRNPLTRRQFFGRIGSGGLVAGLAGTGLLAGRRAEASRLVWQIDPFKCVQCGHCRTHCVQAESAVKCVHDYLMCGICDRCVAYLSASSLDLSNGAENELCPLGAIRRQLIEPPYFEYFIDEPLCTGCGLCVMRCEKAGKGSLYLQVRHDRCLNCNQCAIAAACPAHAFIRLPAGEPYIVRHLGQQDLEQRLAGICRGGHR
jgi:Na+-translocating ferredoxin:NAD+ oxidoreductase subunit B